MRTRHDATLPALAADFYAVTDTLAGFVDNTAIDPEFADPGNGDFSLSANSPFEDWFPPDMPFNESLSKAWSPD